MLIYLNESEMEHILSLLLNEKEELSTKTDDIDVVPEKRSLRDRRMASDRLYDFIKYNLCRSRFRKPGDREKEAVYDAFTRIFDELNKCKRI